MTCLQLTPVVFPRISQARRLLVRVVYPCLPATDPGTHALQHDQDRLDRGRTPWNRQTTKKKMNKRRPIRLRKASTRAEKVARRRDLSPSGPTTHSSRRSLCPIPTRWLVPLGRRSSRRVESAGQTRRSIPTLSWSPSNRRSRGKSTRAGDGGENANQRQKEKGRKNQGGQDGNAKEDQDDDRGGSSDRHEDKHGHSSQAPSLTRILLYSGIVSLVCGIVSALGLLVLLRVQG